MTAVPPFALVDLDHVVIRAHDQASMVAFYREVLGCRLERTAGDLIQLRAGCALIDIVPGREGVAGGRNMDHLCLAITPFEPEQLAGWFAGHGMAAGSVETRYGAEGNGPSIYIVDPEGNGVELKGPPPPGH